MLFTGIILFHYYNIKTPLHQPNNKLLTLKFLNVGGNTVETRKGIHGPP